MKAIIGLIGENGSGKETFTNILEGLIPDASIDRIRTGDILRDILDLLFLPKTRANLQLLAKILRDEISPDSLARAAFHRIQKSTADIVILDGMRWPPEVEILREMPNNILVYITADPKIRFERLRNRKEKTGEGDMSYEQFLHEEQAPAEQLIKTLAKGADITVENSGNLEDLRKKVSRKLLQNLQALEVLASDEQHEPFPDHKI